MDMAKRELVRNWLLKASHENALVDEFWAWVREDLLPRIQQ
jgi:hypothetical protein